MDDEEEKTTPTKSSAFFFTRFLPKFSGFKSSPQAKPTEQKRDRSNSRVQLKTKAMLIEENLLELPCHKRQLFDKEGKVTAPTPETIATVTNAQKVLKVNTRRKQDKDIFSSQHGELMDLMMSER